MYKHKRFLIKTNLLVHDQKRPIYSCILTKRRGDTMLNNFHILVLKKKKLNHLVPKTKSRLTSLENKIVHLR